MKQLISNIIPILILHIVLLPNATSQETEPVPVTGIHTITLDNVRNKFDNLHNAPWKYHPGDNPDWAKPDFDDTTWEYLSPIITIDKTINKKWEGIGWFRLHISVPDEELWNKPLALLVTYQAGASEIYLDGERIYSFGKVGNKEEEEPYWERDPQGFSFSAKNDHVIAVRYSNYSFDKFNPTLGFRLRLSELNPAIKYRTSILRELTTIQMVISAVLGFLMLQHLLLFIFYPKSKENLYFSLLTGSSAAIVFISFQFILIATSIPEILTLGRFFFIVSGVMSLSCLLFLYTLFYTKLPKLFWFFLIGWIGTFILGMFSFDHTSLSLTIDNTLVSFSQGIVLPIISVISGLTILELVRVMIVAIFKRKDGAWIFGLGSLSPFILPFIYGLIIARTGWELNQTLTSLLILLAPIFSMSVYLARNIARTSRNLERETVERQHLEVENTRKTEELEEARKLQLSMLPEKAPDLPNLEVGFQMHPATEVCGDYYDYNITEDGKLTIAIGDATGHGMNSGLVVSAVKSLFKTSDPEDGNIKTLERMSQGVKSMNLKRLYMAMTLATFKDNILTITAAGMPPTLIYNAEEDTVEEIFLEGGPLGGFIGGDREEAIFELDSGDTILMMSDGLPEMLNPKNEMLDYTRTKELFSDIADKSPKAIINHLYDACISWADGEQQTDDITLVVIKVK
ncbi:SpoIIE family protein phosphatase [Candidatus Poribacteria bacterium]|nr:SpoIIE family protein phosphatase [Candidatus Poribacteria bacterium]